MIRRFLLVGLLSAGCLAGFCPADEPREAENAVPLTVEEGTEAVPLARKIMGFGVLAVLLIWLFSKKENREGVDDLGDQSDE